MFDYVISDLHLDHENIISKCNRPFSSGKEMDQTLLTNWNTTVSHDDEVLFLGDLSLTDPQTERDLYNSLNGNITFIIGNHDNTELSEHAGPLFNSIEFETKGLTIKCSHYPENITIEDHTEYGFHGHVHNNDVDTYPFFHPHTSLFNFSAELVGYTPVPFENVLDILLRQKSRKTETYTEHLQ